MTGASDKYLTPDVIRALARQAMVTVAQQDKLTASQTEAADEETTTAAAAAASAAPKTSDVAVRSSLVDGCSLLGQPRSPADDFTPRRQSSSPLQQRGRRSEENINVSGSLPLWKGYPGGDAPVALQSTTGTPGSSRKSSFSSSSGCAFGIAIHRHPPIEEQVEHVEMYSESRRGKERRATLVAEASSSEDDSADDEDDLQGDDELANDTTHLRAAPVVGGKAQAAERRQHLRMGGTGRSPQAGRASIGGLSEAATGGRKPSPITARRAATAKAASGKGRAAEESKVVRTADPTVQKQRTRSVDACQRLYKKAELQRQRELDKREQILKEESAGMGQPTICAKSRQLARGVEPLESRSETVQRMKEENIEVMRQQCDERERTAATHQPRITSLAQQMERTVDDWQRWDNRRKQKQHYELSTRDDRDWEECTFQPQLCSGTKRLARRSSAQNGGLTSFERLSQDAQRRCRAARPAAAPSEKATPSFGVAGAGSSPRSSGSAAADASCLGAGYSSRSGNGEGVTVSFEAFMQGRGGDHSPHGDLHSLSSGGGANSASGPPAKRHSVAAAVPSASSSPASPAAGRRQNTSARTGREEAADVVPFEAFFETFGQGGKGNSKVSGDLATLSSPVGSPRIEAVETGWRSGLPGATSRRSALPEEISSTTPDVLQSPRPAKHRSSLGGSTSGTAAATTPRSSVRMLAPPGASTTPRSPASKASAATPVAPTPSRLSKGAPTKGRSSYARSSVVASKAAAPSISLQQAESSALKTEPSKARAPTNVVAYSGTVDDILRLTMQCCP
eukprot:TRINITY_DN13637_c0_g1_i3.p1 TRINITY_DN13637_c0_g1~~TRINITY_DN13637_c0_g1_i3.p1  ORF type:complete len:797 (+),score=140.01 TRINITY_DN13637_c0_g1_i3:187-2577(+)